MSGEPSPAEGFRAGLEAGELRFQRCGACGAAVFYPRVACPACGGTDLAWEAASGAGTVYATTTVSVRDADDYDVTLVDLDEGIRVMSRVGTGTEVPIGARGRLEVTGAADGPPTRFRLEEAP